MSGIKRWWDKLSRSGNDLYLDISAQRFNVVTNQAMIFFMVLLIYVLVYNVYLLFSVPGLNEVKFREAAVYPAMTTTQLLLLVGCFFIRYRSRNTLVRTWLAVVSFISGVMYVTAGSFFLGPETGFWLYLFLLIPIPFFLFPAQDKYALILCEFLVWVGWISVLIYNHDRTEGLLFIPHEIYSQLFYQVHIFLFFGLVFSSYFLWRQTIETERSLIEISTKDGLTGALTRHRFLEIARIEIEKSRRYSRGLTLIIFDVDHFKRVNDTYGHPVGDRVLKRISKIVLDTIRPSDYLVRWGGEEFVLLLSETGLAGAKAVSYKLKRLISEHDFKLRRRVTASFGVTPLGPQDDVLGAIKRADKALYRAKRLGRNRIETA